MAALIWGAALSVQMRTGLLSVNLPLKSFLALKDTASSASAIVSARQPMAVVLMLLTEGSKLAVLLWAVAAALHRARRNTSRAALNESLDATTGVVGQGVT